MITLTFIEQDGQSRCLDAPIGRSVMEVARDAGVRGILAECGGACACSTCHVYIDPDRVGDLPELSTHEVDMLDFASGRVEGRSRLSCQLKVTKEMDGLVFTMPL